MDSKSGERRLPLAVQGRPPRRKRFQAEKRSVTRGRRATGGVQGAGRHRALRGSQMAIDPPSHSKELGGPPSHHEPAPPERAHKEGVLQAPFNPRLEGRLIKRGLVDKSRYRERVLSRGYTPKPSKLLRFLVEKRALEVQSAPVRPHYSPSGIHRWVLCSSWARATPVYMLIFLLGCHFTAVPFAQLRLFNCYLLFDYQVNKDY